MISDWESWTITKDERMKHDAQFQFLKPVNGYVTGEQAKLFFLKSGLSPLVLGQIWTLADIDADGKLDKKEFSIAMFLIKKKLEGMQLPHTLPIGVKTDPQPAFVSPTCRSPLSSLALDTNAPNDQAHTNGIQSTISPTISSTVTSTNATGATDSWSLSPTSRPKYRLLFNQHDRTKRGFITGVEARGIFIKSGLSQQILAHVWNLADLDKDGNLNCDEFCIAAYLIEKALTGVPLPPTLPPGLLPSQQQNRSVSSGQTSQPSKSTESEDENKASALTFEDKRRENFRQGQLELDKRKQELAEKLRQEEEARLDKERQEREKLEQIRLEKERQQAIEAQRQAERLRELEAQREAKRRQAVETRTKAWRDAEAQRQLEAEKLRVDALKKEKNQAQAVLEQAIAHRASLLESASAQEQRRRELDVRLMVAQSDVDAHKSAINEMRQKRDAYQRDIRELTEQVEAAKAELSRWQREREQLSLRVSTGVDTNPTAEQCKTLQANRELRLNIIERLKAQLKELDMGMTQQGQELASRRNRVEDIERRSSNLLSEMTELRHSLETKVQEYKRKKNSTAGHGLYPDASQSTPGEEKEAYEVMFDFTARHPDELSLTTGTVLHVYVKPSVTVSPGWLYGECNGLKGMFPESYVRKKITGKIDPFDPFGVHKVPQPTSLNPPTHSDRHVDAVQSKPPESTIGTSDVPTKSIFTCVALYPYESAVPGDLNLAINDVIQVHAVRDDWYEGFNERTKLSGIFPANYTQKMTAEDIGSLKQGANSASPTKEVSWPAPSPSETATLNNTIPSPSSHNAPSDTFKHAPMSSDLNPPPSHTGPSSPTSSSSSAVVTSPAVPSTSSSSPTTVIVSTKPEFARVIAPYTATAPGQLSLQPGQVVQLRKRSPKGWWEGELQQRGRVRQFGWFPADYVRLIVPSGTNTLNSVSGGDVTSLNPAPVVTSSAPNNTTATSKPQGNELTSPTPVTSVTTSQPNLQHTTGHQDPGPPTEMMQAIFSYKAAHADELTFDEGAIITVLGRDEPEWWRGRLQSSGVEGLFPVNYVRPYVASNTNTKSSHTGIQRVSHPNSSSLLIDIDVNVVDSHEDKSTLDQLLADVVSQRELAIKELITTEESYTHDLDEVQNVFCEPLRQSSRLTPVQLNRIFLNWSEISAQSKVLLELFTARVQSFVRAQTIQSTPTQLCIGDILVQQLPKLRIYRSYCMRQSSATEALQTYLAQNAYLAKFVRSCELNTRTKGLPLSTYLLKPMQRLTKYKLMIDRIHEHTDQSHPDAIQITQARSLITDILESVNTAVGIKQLDSRIDWLRTRILGDATLLDWLIAKRGASDRLHLIFYGSLYKVKSNRELVGFLFNRYLLLTLPNFSTSNRGFEFPAGNNCDSNKTFRVYRQPVPLSEITVSSGMPGDTGGKLCSSLSNLGIDDILSIASTPQPSSSNQSSALRNSSRDLTNDSTDVKSVFCLFRRSRSQEPFLILRAPSNSERDRWVMHLWNAIRKCSRQTNSIEVCSSVPLTSGVQPLRELLVIITRCWTSNPANLDVRFELSVGSEPRQIYITPVQSDVAQKRRDPMRFKLSTDDQNTLSVWVYDHLVWPEQRELGHTELSLPSLTEWTQPVLTKQLSFQIAEYVLQVELDLQLISN